MVYTKKDIEKWIRNPAIPTIPVQSNWRREHWIEHLVKENGWVLGAELGVWQGRTFLHLLKNCPNLTMIGVDIWEPQPDNEGPQTYTESVWDHKLFEQTVRNKSKVFGDRARILKMLTSDASKIIEDDILDFVFIDADHSSEAVYNDIIKWVPKVKSSGWIIGHDINWPPVKKVIDELLLGYVIGPDNAWGIEKKYVKDL
jgi:predicted O-methyltransferase YrrM